MKKCFKLVFVVFSILVCVSFVSADWVKPNSGGVIYNITNNITSNDGNNYTTSIGFNSTGTIIQLNLAMTGRENLSASFIDQTGGSSLSSWSYNYGGVFNNNSYSNKVTSTSLDIDTPIFSTGVCTNLLLQSEAFATTWVKGVNLTIYSDSVSSPISTKIAEMLSPNSSSDAFIYQNITNSSFANYTWSLWISSPNASAYVNLTINTNESFGVNNVIYLTSYWKRFNITRELLNPHNIVQVKLETNGFYVNVWGSQLESKTSMSQYCGARTTSALSTPTATANIRSALYTLGAISSSSSITSSSGVAVGGALSGASTGAFSGAITDTQAVGNQSYILGLSLVSTTAPTNTSSYSSPIMRLGGMLHNTSTASTSFWDLQNLNYNSYANTGSVFSITYRTNITNINYTMFKINRTSYTVSIPASDNISQMMCLNASQTGIVTAYKC